MVGMEVMVRFSCIGQGLFVQLGGVFLAWFCASLSRFLCNLIFEKFGCCFEGVFLPALVVFFLVAALATFLIYFAFAYKKIPAFFFS